MKKPTIEEIYILEKQSAETLADWWCQLNRWQWPEELPNAMIEKERQESHDNDRGWVIMSWILERIKYRLISRTWNKDMTDEEFDNFYRGTYEGDKVAKAKYEKWQELKVKSMSMSRN
jgi:hypothetical protein